MTMIKTRIRIAPDGTLSGRAFGLPAGEHDAEITVPDPASARGRSRLSSQPCRLPSVRRGGGRA